MNYEYVLADSGEPVGDYELEQMYRDALDDNGDVTIAGMAYSVSHALERVDPIAYRCGFNDYVDSLLADRVIAEHSDDDDD